MILGIDPKVDYAFKHLFGRETTRPILIDLLDSVLDPAAGHEIREIEVLNPFNPKEALDDKLSILDIKARDQAGRQFNIEMQMLASRYYEQHPLLLGQAVPTAAPRGEGLSGAETDAFHQFPRSCAVPQSEALSFLLSALGEAPSLRLHG
jgi:hypothetical protein